MACDQNCVDNGFICDQCGQCIIHQGHAYGCRDAN